MWARVTVAAGRPIRLLHDDHVGYRAAKECPASVTVVERVYDVIEHELERAGSRPVTAEGGAIQGG